ncbi:MAG: hypothetical protein JWR50_3301 [Mucilaginibacter sp.]|nr:hypothetical protein [Mucilaginibacter sp.]
MNDIVYTTTNFRDKKVSVKRAIIILAKSNIEVNEDEAALILNFLYHIATTYNKYDSAKDNLNIRGKSNHKKAP